MKTFSITDIGQKRSSNQDYVFSSEQPIGNLPNLFIVADGMGGHKAGDYASRYTVETLEKLIRESILSEPAAIIESAVKQANTMLLEEANNHEEMKGMGTTLVICTIHDNVLTVANVGDSRLYVVNQEIRQITKDHSLVEEMVRMGEMDKETARNHRDKNIITRAIGAVPEVDVDFFEINLDQEDEILMCTDGLTNMVPDAELALLLQESAFFDAPGVLVDRALKGGGQDNITVLLLGVETTEETNG